MQSGPTDLEACSRLLALRTSEAETDAIDNASDGCELFESCVCGSVENTLKACSKNL